MSAEFAKLEKPKENLNKFQHFFYDYGRYHNNIVNILIHVVCVPLILITLLRMTSFASKVYLESDFNFGLVLIFIFTPIYIYVDFFVGLLTSLEYIIIDHLLKDFTFQTLDLGYSDVKIFLAIHIISWLIQFIGHGFFEKRKPALVDNVFLTINAPMFVNLELFYFLFGYKKSDLIETKKFIVHDIKKYRGEKSE